MTCWKLHLVGSITYQIVSISLPPCFFLYTSTQVRQGEDSKEDQCESDVVSKNSAGDRLHLFSESMTNHNNFQSEVLFFSIAFLSNPLWISSRNERMERSSLNHGMFSENWAMTQPATGPQGHRRRLIDLLTKGTLSFVLVMTHTKKHTSWYKIYNILERGLEHWLHMFLKT